MLSSWKYPADVVFVNSLSQQPTQEAARLFGSAFLSTRSKPLYGHHVFVRILVRFVSSHTHRAIGVSISNPPPSACFSKVYDYSRERQRDRGPDSRDIRPHDDCMANSPLECQIKLVAVVAVVVSGEELRVAWPRTSFPGVSCLLFVVVSMLSQFETTNESERVHLIERRRANFGLKTH